MSFTVSVAGREIHLVRKGIEFICQEHSKSGDTFLVGQFRPSTNGRQWRRIGELAAGESILKKRAEQASRAAREKCPPFLLARLEKLGKISISH